MDLKIKDVADLLQVSERTIKRWVKDEKIPNYRINDQFRFSLMEIENWMMGWQQGHTDVGIFPSLSKKEGGVHKGGMQSFSLYRAIHKGGVYSNIPGSAKQDLICGTMECIADMLGMDAGGLSDLLLDREELMPTALNHGIAVPHTRDFLLPGPFDIVVVVFPEKPIEYGALDGQPVHTLFFLFSSCDKRHLHLLAKLAHLSSSEEACKLLQEKPSKEALLEYIRDWESQICQR
jgi:nitrogen PTS system EIIA component